MSNANQLDIKLGVSGVSVVQNALRSITGSLASLGGIVAGGFSLAGIVALSKSAINAADDMKKLSEQTGGSVEELSKLSYLFQSKELSGEQAMTGLRKLMVHMKATGQQGKSLSEVLLSISTDLAAMPNGIDKVNRAIEIFGERSALGYVGVLSEGPDALQKLLDRADELGTISSQSADRADKFNDSLRDLGFASRSFALSLSSDVLPALTSSINSFSELLKKLREFKSSDTGQTVTGVAGGLLAVGAGAGAYSLASKGLGAIFGVGALAKWSDFVSILKLTGEHIIAIGPKLLRLAGWVGVVTAALVAGVEWWKKWKAEKQAASAEADLNQVNTRLAESIKNTIKLREASGEITPMLAFEIRQALGVAMMIEDVSKRSTALFKVARDYFRNDSQSPGRTPYPDEDTKIIRAKMEMANAANEAAYAENKKSLNAYLFDRRSAIEVEYDIEQREAADDQIAKQVAYWKHETALIELQRWGNEERARINEDARKKEEDARKAAEEKQKKEAQDAENAFRLKINRLGYVAQLPSTDLANLQSTNLMTDKQRNAKALPLMRELDVALKAQQDAFTSRAQESGIGPEDRLDYEMRALDLSRQRYDIAQRIQAIEGDTSVIYNMQAAVNALYDSWSNVARNIAETFTGVITTAVDSLSVNLTEVIRGTKTLNQSLYAIYDTIMTSIVQGIIRMGTQWVVTHVLMKGATAAFEAFKSSLRAKEVSETVAAETAKAPALAANAASASIGSYGLSAVLGTVAALAAISLIVAAATGGFAAGGYTGNMGVTDVAGVVHGREFVLNADATQSIGVSNLQAMNQTGALPVSDASSMTLIMVDSRAKGMELVETSEGRAKLLDFISGNKHRI